jgi:hypothetical protein
MLKFASQAATVSVLASEDVPPKSVVSYSPSAVAVASEPVASVPLSPHPAKAVTASALANIRDSNFFFIKVNPPFYLKTLVIFHKKTSSLLKSVYIITRFS